MSRFLINRIKSEFKLPIIVCDLCNGTGEISTFCGHDVEEYCKPCKGKGYITVKQKKKGK
jgi:DnaJ-class molecular chaperone